MRRVVRRHRLVDVSGLQEQLRAFSRARDWEQFHRPKNLARAIAGEAAAAAKMARNEQRFPPG